MLPRPSLGSNPGTTSPPGRSPELQTAGRCALQARHGAPEPPEPPESMARKPRQETAAAKVADHARRLAATVEPWPGPGPQGDPGRLRLRSRRGRALRERAEGSAYPARWCLSVLASPLRPTRLAAAQGSARPVPARPESDRRLGPHGTQDH